MSAETRRHIKALMLVIILASAEIHRVQADFRLKSSASRSSSSGAHAKSWDVSTDTSFQKLVAKQIEVLLADPNLHEYAARFAETVVLMISDPQIQEQATRFAEQMDGMNTKQIFRESMKYNADQMKQIMTDPSLQEHAERAAELLLAMNSNPYLQLQAKIHSKPMWDDPNLWELTANHIDNVRDASDKTPRVKAPHPDIKDTTSRGQAAALEPLPLTGKLADKLVSKLASRVFVNSHFHYTSLRNVTIAKPGRLAIPSLLECTPTFPPPRPDSSANRAQSHLRQRVPVTGKPSFPSESNPLIKAIEDFDAMRSARVRRPCNEKKYELVSHVFERAFMLSILLSPISALADEQASKFAIVKKSGFIGSIASVIETGINGAHDALEAIGVTSNTYGVSIILFTILVRTLTLPLAKAQIEAGAKTQQIAPLAKKIREAFPEEDQDSIKNQLTGVLYQTAQVNPFAGCLPSIVQIPLFLSLYRALANLVAEGKLKESFLWLPSLEGPTFGSTSAEWFTSIFSGTPSLGWDDTLAYLSIPALLVVTQTAASQLLNPPVDTDREISTQEKAALAFVNFLPFLFASFTLTVPSGLGLYYIASNLVTTSISLALRANLKTEDLPPKVQEIMATIERGEVPDVEALLGDISSQQVKNLVDAARFGSLNATETFLKEGSDPNMRAPDGLTVLQIAAGAGHVRVMKALIKAGARMDITDAKGYTALHFAAGYGKKQAVLVLLDAGAEVSVTKAFESPADVAKFTPGWAPNAVRDDKELMARLVFK